MDLIHCYNRWISTLSIWWNFLMFSIELVFDILSDTFTWSDIVKKKAECLQFSTFSVIKWDLLFELSSSLLHRWASYSSVLLLNYFSWCFLPCQLHLCLSQVFSNRSTLRMVCCKWTKLTRIIWFHCLVIRKQSSKYFVSLSTSVFGTWLIVWVPQPFVRSVPTIFTCNINLCNFLYFQCQKIGNDYRKPWSSEIMAHSCPGSIVRIIIGKLYWFQMLFSNQ